MENNILHHITKNYNAAILDNINLEDIDKILQTANNPVITRLVNNRYNMNKPVVEHISGPSSLTEHWSPELNKRVYVFGEYHGNNGCINGRYTLIQNYLKRLFNTTDVFIDFFLEISAHRGSTWSDEYSKRVNSGGYFIDRIRQSFEKCIQSANKDFEDCQLVRVHYGDVRFVEDYPVSTIGKMIHVAKTSDDKIYKALRSKEVKTILRTLLQSDAVNRLTVNLLETNKYIKKELSKSYLKPVITNFIKENIENEIEYRTSINEYTMQQCAQIILATNTFDSDKISFFKYIINNYLLYFESFAMDAYTLARIFKVFDTLGYAYQPSHANNVIIYAGESHANRYRKFFKETGFQLLSRAGDSNQNFTDNCLNMYDVPQPLFN